MFVYTEARTSRHLEGVPRVGCGWALAVLSAQHFAPGPARRRRKVRGRGALTASARNGDTMNVRFSSPSTELRVAAMPHRSRVSAAH